MRVMAGLAGVAIWLPWDEAQKLRSELTSGFVATPVKSRLWNLLMEFKGTHPGTKEKPAKVVTLEG